VADVSTESGLLLVFSDDSAQAPSSLRMRFSPDSKLSDLIALLDSYSVEVHTEKGLSLLRCPVYMLYPSLVMLDSGFGFAEPVALKLCSHQEPDDESGRMLKTRWPFFVDQPLSVQFALGNQWWQYDFNPGKTYQERSIV